MKKKIALLLVAATMVGTLSGCVVKVDEEVSLPATDSKPVVSVPGTENESSDVISSSPETTTTTKAPETTTTTKAPETTTTTKAPETTTVTPEPAPNVPDGKVMTNAPYVLNNGEYLLYIEGQQEYLFNTLTNKMIEVDSSLGSISFALGDVIGYQKNSALGIYSISTGKKIYEGENSFAYASKDGNLNSDTILIGRSEESFEGNKLYYGLLDGKGKWKYEMKADRAMLNDEYSGTMYYKCGDYMVMLGSDGEFAYSFKDDTVTTLSKTGSGKAVMISNNKLLIVITRNFRDEAYVFDGITGKSTQLRDADTIVIGLSYESTCISGDGKHAVYDNSTLEDYGFDFSKYDSPRFYGACKDKVVLSAENPDGQRYAIIADKNGKMLVDPIKEESIPSANAYFMGDSVVVMYENSVVNPSFIYNFKTKDKLESTKAYKIIGVCSVPGYIVAFVKNDDVNGFFLVDPENPDVLINPFAVAKY